MGQDIYKNLDKQYESKRQQALFVAEEKEKEIENKFPKYAELKEQLNSLAIEHTKQLITKKGIEKQIAEDNITVKITEKNKEIKAYLKSIGVDEKSFEPQFECDRCNDKGVIFENNVEKRCPCFVQNALNAEYSINNLLKLKDENFSTFDTCYFSNIPNKEKYQTEKSPKENIESIKQIALTFCENFNQPSQKNLLFIGNTGTGKTFMSSAIAERMISKGKTALYQTAPMILDAVLDFKFSQNKTVRMEEQYNKVYNVELLIIDDLGTETMSNTKFTELLNIINTRLLKNKKTIISTNLMLPQIAEQYDERVTSRFIGDYIICKFYGDDIRLKKKKMNI